MSVRRMIAVALFAIAATSCVSNDHLIFFTNSTIGLEIASEPQTGNPSKFVLGYKRQEGVIDPLYGGYDWQAAGASTATATPSVGNASAHDAIVATKNGYFVQKPNLPVPHSVLAKINFGATTPGAGASVAQWFATGKAAELLAQAPGISAAVSGLPRVETVERSLALSSGTTFKILRQAYADLGDADILATLSPADVTTAGLLRIAVNELDKGVFRQPFPLYGETNDPSMTKFVLSTYPTAPPTTESFDHVLDHVTALEKSISVATAMVKAGPSIHLNGAPILAAAWSDVVEFLSTAPSDLVAAKGALEKDRRALDLVEFWYENTLLTNSGT